MILSLSQFPVITGITGVIDYATPGLFFDMINFLQNHQSNFVLIFWKTSSHSFHLLDTLFLNLLIYFMTSRIAGVALNFPFSGFVLPTCFLAASVITF